MAGLRGGEPKHFHLSAGVTMELTAEDVKVDPVFELSQFSQYTEQNSGT